MNIGDIIKDLLRLNFINEGNREQKNRLLYSFLGVDLSHNAGTDVNNPFSEIKQRLNYIPAPRF